MARYRGPDGFNCDFKEHIPGSPEITLERDRSGARRVLDCDWNDATRFAKSLLGYPGGITTYAGSTYIRRYPPHEYPDKKLFTQSSGGASLRAVRVSIRGLGAASYSDEFTGEETYRVATYPTARLTVDYATLPYEIWTDQSLETLWGGDEAKLVRYVSKRAAPAGQVLVLPGGTYKFVPYDGSDSPPSGLGGRPVLQGTHKLVIHTGLTLTWHQIPEAYVPCAAVRPAIMQAAGGPQAIDNSLGKVNNAVFAGYPAGSLLFNAIQFEQFTSPFGQRYYNVVYGFKFLQQGHNRILKQHGGEARWYETTTSGTTNLVAQTDGLSIYDWADFSALFKPAPIPVV